MAKKSRKLYQNFENNFLTSDINFNESFYRINLNNLSIYFIIQQIVSSIGLDNNAFD